MQIEKPRKHEEPSLLISTLYAVQDSREPSISSMCRCASGRRIHFATRLSISWSRSPWSVSGRGLMACVTGVFPVPTSERCACVKGTRAWIASFSTIETTVWCIQVCLMSASRSCFGEHSAFPSLHRWRRSRCPKSSEAKVAMSRERKTQAWVQHKDHLSCYVCHRSACVQCWWKDVEKEVFVPRKVMFVCVGGSNHPVRNVAMMIDCVRCDSEYCTGNIM